MKLYIKIFSLVLAVAAVLTTAVSAEDETVYTPLHSKNLLAGKEVAMAGGTVNNYDFAEWNGITNIDQLNDGILSVNGRRQTAIVHGVPDYRKNGAVYFIVYDLGAYYDLTSAALYSNVEDKSYAVDGWDFYAGETIEDYTKAANKTVGKTEENKKLDYQVALVYRKVRYVAFSIRRLSDVTSVRISELEVFGKLSKDQSVKPTSQDVKVSGGNSVRVTLDTVWNLKSGEGVPNKVSVDILGADERKAAFEKANYAYKIYESFFVDVYSADGATDNRNQPYTVTVEVPEKLKNIDGLKLLAVDGIAEELSAEYKDGKFTFTANSMGEFAFGVPNYKEDAEISVTDDFYPAD